MKMLWLTVVEIIFGEIHQGKFTAGEFTVREFTRYPYIS